MSEDNHQPATTTTSSPVIVLEERDEEALASSDAEDNKQEERYSLWLLDRTRGRSHPDLDSKPPLFCCYVPKPIWRLRKILEMNVVCETTGRLGCVDHDDPKIRRRVLTFGLVANLLALGVTVYACFAISKSFDILRATSFSRGQVSVQNPFNNGTSTRVLANIDIGLTAVAFENVESLNLFREVGEHVITFDSFCSLVGDGLERYMDPAQCQACEDSSSGLVTTILFSLVSIMPTLTTDVLRMYPNYDVNCQKFFGTIISALSMALSLLTYIKYNRECFSVFYEGVVPYYLNQTVVTDQFFDDGDDAPVVEAHFDWSPGPGVICMFVATSLKIIDIIAMLIVPTPDMTRHHELQKEYELLYQDSTSGGGGEDGFVKGEEEDAVEQPLPPAPNNNTDEEEQATASRNDQQSVPEPTDEQPVPNE